MRAASARAASSHSRRRDSRRARAGRRLVAAVERGIPVLSRQSPADGPGRAPSHGRERRAARWPIARSIGSRTASFPSPNRSARSRADNWREFLGQREREGDYRAFFAGEVARLGATPAAIHLSPAAHAGHRGERDACAHAHGLCDADRQRRGDRRRARLLGRDLSSARAFARGRALDRRSGRGSRLHVWAGGVPACRARARSPLALHARGRREARICARRRHAGDRARDA